MKSFLISAALALLATQIHAAPTAPKAESRQFSALITFHGADPDAFFTQEIPADNEPHPITNPLSITSISSEGGATCSFLGIDGSSTVVVGANTAVVGPPQTQVSGSCQAL